MEEHPIYGFARHYNPNLSDAEIKAKFIDGGKYLETLDRMRQETYPDLDQELFLTKFHSKYEDLSKKKEPTVSVASTSAGIKDATYSWDAPDPKLVSGVASIGPMTTQASSGTGVAMEEPKRASQELALKKARERGSFDRPAQLSETQKAQIEASVFEDKEYKTKFSILSEDTNTLQKAIEASEARIKEKWGENWMQDYNARVEAINNPETQNREELIREQQEFEADQYINDRNNFITALEANQEAGKELLYSDKYERARALEKIDQERQKKAETQGWGNSVLGIAQRAASKFVGSAGHLMNIGENILTKDKKYTTWDAVEDFLIDFQSETEKVAPRPTKYTRPLFTKTATTTLNGQKVQIDYDGDKPAIIRDSKGAVIRPVSESDNFDLKPKNQWNGKGLVYQTGEVLADVLVQAATTKGIGGTLIKTGMGAKTAYQVGVTASTMGQMAGPLYNEGLKMFDGDKKKASIYAATAGLAIGVSSNLFGLESRLAGGKGGFLDNMTVAQVAKSLNPKTAGIQRAKSMLKEGLGEAFEETILEQGIQSATAMMLNGDPEDIDLNEMKGTAVISFAVGALLGGSLDNSMWLVAAENPDEFRKALQAEKDAGKNVDVEKMYNKALKIRGLSEIKDVTEEDIDALDKVSELKDKSEKAKAIGLDEQAKVFKEEAANLEKEVLKEKEVEGENINVTYETSKLEGAKVNIDGEIGMVEKTDSGYVLNTGEELLPIEDEEVEAQLIERGTPVSQPTEQVALPEVPTTNEFEDINIVPKTIEQLGEENKSTYPKIPTEKVFANEVSQPSDRFSVDQAIESGQELPIESVRINDIIPTQKNLTISNLEATKDIENPDEPIILVKENGKYYVKDGHHRIANAILNGNSEVEAQIFNNQIEPAIQIDKLINDVYEKYTGDEASKKISELFKSKQYQDLQDQLDAENPLGPSTSDFKTTLSEKDAEEYEEFEQLRTKSVSMDANNKYKPYVLTSKEKSRYKELGEKFIPLYKKYASDKIKSNKISAENAKSKRLSSGNRYETSKLEGAKVNIDGEIGVVEKTDSGYVLNTGEELLPIEDEEVEAQLIERGTPVIQEIPTVIDELTSVGNIEFHPKEPIEQDIQSVVERMETSSKKKLSPMKMVGVLTKDLPDKGNRKRLKTAMGEVGDNYTIGDVEVTLSEDLDFGEVDGEEQQADVSINFIGVTKPESRGKGLASKELDRIIGVADSRGMSLSLTVDPQGATMGMGESEKENTLSAKELKEWYKKRGFIFDEDSSYGYRPARSIEEVAKAYIETKTSGENPSLVAALEEVMMSSSKAEPLEQKPPTAQEVTPESQGTSETPQTAEAQQVLTEETPEKSTRSETLPIIDSLPPGVNGFMSPKFFGFVMNSKAMDWVKKIFVNTFYAGGNLPKDVAALNYRRIARIQGMMKQAEITSNKLKGLIKGKSKQQVIELNDALQTGADTYADGTPIEPEVLLTLGDMRKHIDSLSQALISSGIATGKLEAVISENLETYLTRSYEVHFNKDWIKKVKDTAAYTRARAYLENKFAQEEIDAQQKIAEYQNKRPNNPEFWDRKIEKQRKKIGRDVDAELEAMLMKQSKDLRMADVAKSGSLGSMNLGVFKKRKDIPEEIRGLFGEVKDPLVNYMTSIFKIAHILENNKFLAEVEKQGLNKFLFDRPTGNHTVALPDTAQMGDLAGYYTTPEIARAFKEYNKPIGDFDENSDLPTQLYGGLMKVSALSKSFMTVFSIGSGFRNIFSNPFLMLQKGGLNPGSKHVKKAIETFRNKDEKEIVELYSRGVMGEGITFAELTDIRKQYQKEMRGVPKDAVDKFKEGFKKYVTRPLEAFYAFGDDFFRVVDYYRNQDKMAVLNYGKKFKNLTPDEQEAVKQLAADRVSSESPTYSRLPRNIKALRRNPVVAPFPSFPYEMVRVSYNIFANLINDMKNGQDMTVKVGGVEMSYKNLMFAKTMIGAATVSIVPFIIKDIAKIALGWDDDDEESLKYFVPFYHEGSILIPHTSNNGNVSYLDLGYMMPQGHILSTFAAFNDTRYNVAENTLRASEKFFEPFYSLDPLMKASIEAVSGSMLGKTGRPISVIGEQGWLLDRFYHVQNKMTPGTVKSFQRVLKSFNEPETDYYGKLDPLAEGIAIFPGYRSHNVDIHRSFGFVSQNIAKKIDDTRLDYKIQAEKESTKAMTPDDRKEYLDKIREREIKDYNKFVTDLHKIYVAAVDFPEVDKRKIDQALETVKLDPVTRNNVKNGKLDLPKFLRQ